MMTKSKASSSSCWEATPPTAPRGLRRMHSKATENPPRIRMILTQWSLPHPSPAPENLESSALCDNTSFVRNSDRILMIDDMREASRKNEVLDNRRSVLSDVGLTAGTASTLDNQQLVLDKFHTDEMDNSYDSLLTILKNIKLKD